MVVADTCGCGDAFTAGFIGAFLGGRSLEECARRGVRLGSVVASQIGATEPMPSEVLQTLRS
jgi:sugar/nucleoside kinase (ribokinase family)